MNTKQSFPRQEFVSSPGKIDGGGNGLRVAADVRLGAGVKLFGFVNLYGCEIGDETRIGCFVEVQRGAKIGARCKISSHTFICEGVIIEDEVFIGHGVMFINDRWPRASDGNGCVLEKGDWECQATRVRKGASIGSGATILGGLTIGGNSMVGAGSVVTHDVPANSTVAGNPARPIKRSAEAPADGRRITAGTPNPAPANAPNMPAPATGPEPAGSGIRARRPDPLQSG